LVSEIDEDAPPGQDDALMYWRNLAAAGGLPASAAPAAAETETPGPQRTTSDGTPLSQILIDRPDVLRDFYVQYYEHNDHRSSAWVDRVGGETPEDYANYWYETYGKHGEYSWSPSGGPAAAPLEGASKEERIGRRVDRSRGQHRGPPLYHAPLGETRAPR
jgi:hypothetical protein